MSPRFSALCAVVLGAGCLPVDASERAANGQVQQPLAADCDEYMCGTNSPQIAELGFWDLQVPPAYGVPGAANPAGLQVILFWKNAPYLPRVRGGRLFADPVLSTPPYNVQLSSASLIGGFFYLRNVHDNRYFKLEVREVGSVASWAQPPRGKVELETYQLDWAQLIRGAWNRSINVCKNPLPRTNPDVAGMTGNTLFHTLLFEGDRIDAAKKLDTGIDESWFNLGCAGSALAKLALTGHTQGALNAGTFATPLGDRQAMLKMLTGDLCGDGTPYTVGGQWLNWRDDRGTMKMLSLIQTPPEPVVFEARWTKEGPACLNEPRVDAHPTPDATAMFGTAISVYRQAELHCPTSFPPLCPDDDVDSTGGYHLVSATPL
jgi:hypothetical protein